MTMIFDTNFVPATYAEAVFRTKQLLKTAGWVHQASGDGLAAFSATPGNINDVIAAAGAGAGGMANTNAWFVIKEPGSGTRQICYQRGLDNTRWRVKYSVAAGFNGGTPSATTTPTATDEQFLAGLKTAPDVWVEGASMPSPVVHCACGVLNDGRVIIAGGWANAGGSGRTKATWIYDPVANTWTAKADMNSIRSHASYAVLPNGKFLVAGGENGSGAVNTAEVYDPVGDSWTPTGLMSATRRSNSDPEKNGNCCILITAGPHAGNVIHCPSPNPSSGFTDNKTSEIYNVAGNTWGNIATKAAPYPTYSTVYARLTDGRIFGVLGQDDGSGLGTTMWDPSTNTWTNKADLLETNYQPQIVEVQSGPHAGKVFLAGGWDVVTPTNKVKIYDPTGDSWSVGSPLAAPRWTYTLGYTSDGDLLAIAGSHNQNPSAYTAWSYVDKYDPVTDSWSTVNQINSAVWQTIGQPISASFVGQSKFIILGGLQDALVTGPGIVSILAPGDLTQRIPIYNDGEQTFNVCADTAPPYGWWAGGYGFDFTEWLNFQSPGPNSLVHAPDWRTTTAIAHDKERQETVLFGGDVGQYNDETWLWNGTRWRVPTSYVRPSARIKHAIAYDEINKKVILFGGDSTGSGADSPGETWEWDGLKWTQLLPATSPPGRASHMMVYSQALGQIVMFGGKDATSTVLNDTWAWTGTDWTLLHNGVSGAPSARESHGLSIDPVNGTVLLFGGQDAGGVTNNETWQFDTVLSTWTQLFPATSPAERTSITSMTWDENNANVILFGGDVGTPFPAGDSSETWLWDGTTWTLQSLGTRHPPERSSAHMAYDSNRQEIVLIGGSSGTYYSDTHNGKLATWLWDGAQWSTRRTAPSSTAGHRMAYDSVRNRIVLFGGVVNSGVLGQTWEWDGVAWERKFPATSPPARHEHAMAFDEANSEVVLFGGLWSPTVYNDTWTYNGTNWTQKFPVTNPSARWRSAMAYHSGPSPGIIMFGGAVFPNSQTYKWDGTNWTQLFPATSPGPRYGHAMANYASQGILVLFGGRGGGAPTSDTWTWDGTTWTHVFPATTPEARDQHSMVYDIDRDVIVMISGNSVYQYPIYPSRIWTYDNSNWSTDRNFLGNIPVTQYANDAAAAYDALNGQIVHVQQSTSITVKCNGPASGFMIFDPIKNPLAEDGDPYVLYFSRVLPGVNPSSIGGLGGMFNTGYVPDARAHFRYGISGDVVDFNPVIVNKYDAFYYGAPVPGGLSNDPALVDRCRLFPAVWTSEDYRLAVKGESSLLLLPSQTFGYGGTAISTTGVNSRDYLAIKDGPYDSSISVAFPWDGSNQLFSTDINGPYSGNTEAFSGASGSFTNVLETPVQETSGVVMTLSASQVELINDELPAQEPLKPVGGGAGVVYRMRARDTTLNRFVFWTSDIVDVLGSDYAGPGPIVDPVVQKTIRTI